MTNPNEDRPWAWRILILALLLALGFSAWALLGSGACTSCEGAARLLPSSALAILGLLYYSLLLGLAFLLGPHPIVYGGALLGAGVHAGLLTLLLEARLFCPPCIGAALSAGVALVSALRSDPANFYRASFIVPAAALVVQSWGLLGGTPPGGAESRGKAADVAPDVFSSPAPSAGKVRMLVYTRPDCGYCRELEREVLPGLIREFGDRLLVERRAA
ncbi:MAG TPA: hypothetical protein VMU54_15765, partial [Planctomycetota bacterium]|nr:hypothetical protein [Planctomycetota bacterium]